MIIRDVKTVVLSCSLKEAFGFGKAPKAVTHRNALIVQILTDEGISGIGECASVLSLDGIRLVKSITNNRLKPLVVEEDPFNVERIWDKMYQATYEPRMPIAVCLAMSGVDIALWDIVGKATKTPLYKLLGGFRDEVPAYASGGYYQESKNIDGLVKEVSHYVDEGFRAVKMKVGRLELNKDIERIKAVRSAVGADVDIMIDANCAWDVFTVIKAAKELEKQEIRWLEEPLPSYDVKGLAKIRQSINIPIATGEQEFRRYVFRDLVADSAVDILQVDATVCGGLTEWRKIAALADTYRVSIAPHAEPEIHMHAIASIPNGLTVEFFPSVIRDPLTLELFAKPIEIKGGYIKIPAEPGLGIELNEITVKKYQIE